MDIKNLAIYFFVVASSVQGAAAQSLKIIGSIRDKANVPIPNANVVMNGSQQGGSTNAGGNFTLAINPGSQLIITAPGYETDTIDIDHEDKLAIVLRGDGLAAGASKAGGSVAAPGAAQAGTVHDVAVQSSVNDFKIADTRLGAPNTTIREVSSGKEETRGSKFLFSDWCQGIVTDVTNTLIDDRYYLLNYNKMTKSLVLTTDMKSGVELYKSQLKQFELKDRSGQKHLFVVVPALNDGNFVECLAKGDKYALYEVVSTRFKESDYHYDGIAESGHNYDEYIDDTKYYVTDGKGANVKLLEMKKKSILAAFADDKDKVDAYFKKNTYDHLDALYMKAMVNSLNQP